jgi:hypothetical protein
MSLKFTNLNTYMRQSIDSFIDQQIFSELYEFYNKPDKVDFSQPNLAALASTMLSNLISFIIYSTLTLESFANLLGNCVLPKGYHEKYLEKLKILDKISAVIEIEYGGKIDRGSNPFQIFNLLVKERNKLTHDKGNDFANVDNFRIEVDKRKIEIDTHRLLKGFLEFDKYLNNINCEVEFISGLNRQSIKEWLGNSNHFLKVSGPLPYSNAIFPNLHEYMLTVRRHTGFEPVNCIADHKEMVIRKR